MNMHVRKPEVRIATEFDLPGILDLIRQPDFDSAALELDAAKEIWARMANYPSYRTLVAEDRRGIVGTLAIILIDHLGHMAARVALVENVIVRAEARDEGVGKALIAAAGRLAAEAGAYKMILATGMKRTGAHEFYEKLGFERYGYSYGLPLREALA
ncbi:MAG: GNAT family N-acetyltransferase [Phyllobacteriaceae bacterium]|nr:GNAT family N-acetyltransferase [Phyllobacteriaceae bacterium]